MKYVVLSEDRTAIVQSADLSEPINEKWLATSGDVPIFDAMAQQISFSSSAFTLADDGSVVLQWTVEALPDDQIAALKADYNTRAQANRRAGFALQLDPLTMKMLRGETDAHGAVLTTEGLATLASDIRARFPYQ
jgi:hypothetical protein